jgi:2-methylisocitrate lyase-like PEP mutase family enzyme
MGQYSRAASPPSTGHPASVGNVPTPTDRAASFAALHKSGPPLLMPNPWDAGSARILASLGFRALATTSAGFAGTLGRRDGSVTREEAITHAATIVEATDLPVSADLENGFSDAPAGVAETIAQAVDVGLAGCSVEDYDGENIYDMSLARERVQAACEAAHNANEHFVLTARAENFIRGNPDLADTIQRLQMYESAGADVVYAPGVSALDDIKAIVDSVSVPVNVLALPNVPPVAELAAIGVARISVGGAFSSVAWAALAEAGAELLEEGTYGFWQRAGRGGQIARAAFTS